MNKILTLGAVLSALVGSLAGRTAAIDLSEMYSAVDRSLVTVEYKAEMTVMGQSEDMEGRVLGLVIENEMVIFDGAVFNMGDGLSAGGYGAPQVTKPKSLKITDYSGKSYNATYVGVDDFSSVAFARLPDSAVGRIDPADFVGADLTLGQQVYILWLLPENFEPRFQIGETFVTAVVNKPETFFVLGMITPDFVMSPVMTADGQLAGIVTVASQTSFSPMDMGTIMGPPVGLMPHHRLVELLSRPPEPDAFKRGWLGISLQALDPEIARFWGIDVDGGIIVNDVVKDSPADVAGLKIGDFVIAINGEPIDVTEDINLPVFQKKISEAGAGSAMTLTCIRPGDGQPDTSEVSLTLTERPISANDAPRYEDKNFELTVRDLVFADYNIRGLKDGEIKGVVVDKLETGGWAAIGGIDPEQVIMKINDRFIESVDQFKEIMLEIAEKKDRETVFMIWSYNKTQFVHVKTHWNN